MRNFPIPHNALKVLPFYYKVPIYKVISIKNFFVIEKIVPTFLYTNDTNDTDSRLYYSTSNSRFQDYLYLRDYNIPVNNYNDHYY